MDPDTEVIKKLDTFSDQSGVFKIDNFRIPIDGKAGTWQIDVKSGSNFDSFNFEVKGNENEMTLTTDKTVYSLTETITIQGSGATGSTITLKILDLDWNKIDCMNCTLNINAKSDGDFSTIWLIPIDLVSGEYQILADDGIRNASVKFIVSWSTNGFYFSIFFVIWWI